MTSFQDGIFIPMKNLIFLLLLSVTTYAQTPGYKSWNPAAGDVYALEGQGWKNGETFYDRLPASAKQTVRKEVWGLSKNSAGMQLHFVTNAREVQIRYGVAGSYEMRHMPATGVSGVDLYFRGENNAMQRLRPVYSFGDTVKYVYSHLETAARYHYTLYLPLYNSVKWMEISVPEDSYFEPLPVRQKPIVVYGTSIAQGGCASRPGLGWTNILSRMTDKPLINLAFSGNGKMEPELVDLLAELDASLFIIDCLPNLAVGTDLSAKVNYVVSTLQRKRPGVPILFADHCGTPVANDDGGNEKIRTLNRQQKSIVDSLIQKGKKNLYYLTQNEIGLTEDDVVDFIHPNDIGMMRYAEAYYRRIMEIMD